MLEMNFNSIFTQLYLYLVVYFTFQKFFGFQTIRDCVYTFYRQICKVRLGTYKDGKRIDVLPEDRRKFENNRYLQLIVSVKCEFFSCNPA